MRLRIAKKTLNRGGFYTWEKGPGVRGHTHERAMRAWRRHVWRVAIKDLFQSLDW